MPDRRDPSRTLAVKVGPSRRGYVATVEVIDRKDGATVASRTVEGTTCQDVASAALLLVALGSTEATVSPKSGEPEEARSAPPAPPPPSDGASPSAAVLEPPRARPAFHATALSAVGGGAGPIALGAGARIAGALEGHGLFRPELGLGLDAFMDATIARASGTASRSLIAGRADVCPVGLGPRQLVVRVCASGALGEIRVRGEGVPRTTNEGRLYAVLGGSVRGRMRVAGGLGIEIAAGWAVPLRAHRFFFEPDATVVALAPAPFAEGGLSWSIP